MSLTIAAYCGDVRLTDNDAVSRWLRYNLEWLTVGEMRDELEFALMERGSGGPA